MLTIKDIAKLAGVSQSTVSKALNDRHDVSAHTKNKILDIIRKNNYRPNAFAKGLKMKTRENIGIIFCQDLHALSSNPFYSRVLEGIEAETAINNYNLIIHIINENTKENLPKMVRERQVDGIILFGIFSKQYLDCLIEENIPIVFIDPKQNYDKFCQIMIDNEHGAFLATQYLIDHGHRNIGFISGDITRMSFKQRYAGYLKALRLNNIKVNEELIKTGGIESGYEQVKELLKHKTTAIFAANDINALYGFKAIHDLNLKIPDDISIIGFDDIDLAKISTPPLTTIRVYKEELGSIGVRTLLKTIQGEIDNPVNTIVPVKLIERQSVRKRDVLFPEL